MHGRKPPRIPLPKSWKRHVRTAMLHVISLAQYTTAYTRSWAVDIDWPRRWILDSRGLLRFAPRNYSSSIFYPYPRP